MLTLVLLMPSPRRTAGVPDTVPAGRRVVEVHAGQSHFAGPFAPNGSFFIQTCVMLYLRCRAKETRASEGGKKGRREGTGGNVRAGVGQDYKRENVGHRWLLL